MYQWISCNKRQITALIATLITMTVFRGLTMIYMDGKPISNLGDSFTLKVVGKGNFLSHSDSGHLVFTDFCDLLIRTAENNFRTSYLCDRKQCKAANLAGVNIDCTKLAAYAISGCMAALSGLILLSRLGSAQPTLGEGYRAGCDRSRSTWRNEYEWRTWKDLGNVYRRSDHCSTEQWTEYSGCIFLLSGCGKRNCNFDRGIVWTEDDKRGEYGMRMKRFVSVLAAAVMVFGVTGCNAITIDGETRNGIRKAAGNGSIGFSVSTLNNPILCHIK